MKKLLALAVAVAILSGSASAQTREARSRSIGVSFLLNDFTTAQRIRSSNFESVVREKQWADIDDMEPGLAISYIQGLRKHIDFTGTLALSYVKYPLPGKPPVTSSSLLMEADASVNLKMFSDDYWVSPYLILGVGASKYKSYYGAFIPVGGGVRVNFFDEASLFVTAQYRNRVTDENVNYHFFYNIGISGSIGKR